MSLLCNPLHTYTAFIRCTPRMHPCPHSSCSRRSSGCPCPSHMTPRQGDHYTPDCGHMLALQPCGGCCCCQWCCEWCCQGGWLCRQAGRSIAHTNPQCLGVLLGTTTTKFQIIFKRLGYTSVSNTGVAGRHAGGGAAAAPQQLLWPACCGQHTIIKQPWPSTECSAALNTETLQPLLHRTGLTAAGVLNMLAPVYMPESMQAGFLQPCQQLQSPAGFMSMYALAAS